LARQQHTIDHQIINLEIEGVEKDDEIREIQQAIAYYFKSRLGEELDKKLSKLVPPNVYITLDSLTLDLGNISFKTMAELERELYRKLEKVVTEAVKKKLKKIKQTTKSKTGQSDVSKTGIFEYFLRYGYYPSWADKANGSIQDIFAELIRKKNSGVDQVILKLKGSRAARERLFQQFRKEDLEILVARLYRGQSDKILRQIQLVQKRMGKAAEKAVLGAAINLLLERGNIKKVKPRSFARVIVEEVQNRKITTIPASKVRAGYTDRYSDIQILQYFLDYGAIPYWGEVKSKKSFKELFHNLLDTRLASLQRLVERNAHKNSFIKRLIYQFDTEDILQLFEPTPGENIRFIQDSIDSFDFLSKEKDSIEKTLGTLTIRETILTAALDYFFVQGKSRFVKQTFMKTLLEQFSELSSTSYQTLVKESYKKVRRKTTPIKDTLEQLDAGLQSKVEEEKQEIRASRRTLKDLERQLRRIDRKIATGKLTETELKQLKKEQSTLQRKLSGLEKKIQDLGGEEAPLEIELVLKQRQLLQTQMQRANLEAERQKIEKRITAADRDFKKLQSSLKKDLQRTLKEREKLKKSESSAGEKRLKRVQSRLKKFQRAIDNVLAAIKQDEKSLILFLENIRVAFRSAKTSEEKRKLRQERERIEKELVAVRQYIEELEQEAIQLKEEIEEEVIIVQEEQKVQTTRTSKLDYLIFFLKYGSTPWWADDFKTESVEALFLEFANKDPKKLLRAFQTVGKYPIVWQRAVNQLSEKSLETIVQKLYPNNAKVIIGQAAILATIHYSQGFEKLKSADSKQFKWQAILEYLLLVGDTFNPKKFVKEITIQSARNYGLQATRLLEFSKNIADNYQGEELDDFVTWSQELKKDEEIAQTDRALIAQIRQEKLQKDGLMLTNAQKLNLLIEFLESGRISETAKSFKITEVGHFEQLLYEQIQKNKAAVQDAVGKLLQLSNTRSVIINQFSESVFWEVVQLLKPSAALPAKRYFEDIKKAVGDNKLILEKEVLFNYFLQHGGKFESLDYTRMLVLYLRQTTNRKIIPILEDWKRKLKRIQPNSSFLLTVYALEIEAIREEQRPLEDLELRKNLQDQIETLTEEYNLQSQRMLAILTDELAETQGIPEKQYKLSEINSLTSTLKVELDKLENKISTAGALEKINLQRQIARLKAQIKLLHLRKPPTVRILSEKIEKQKIALEKINTKIEQQANTDVVLEQPTTVPEIEPSLAEQQIEILRLVRKKAPTVVDLLTKLLPQLVDQDQTHHLFVKEIEQIVAMQSDEDYATEILLALGEHATDVPTVARLQNEAGNTSELDQRQQSLLKKIQTASPFELWNDWDNLQAFYAANPVFQSKEKEVLQKQIFRQIKRRHQRNLLEFASVLQQAQQKVINALEEATTTEEVEAIIPQIETLEQQQLQQVAEIVAAAREPDIQTDFEVLQKNIKKQIEQIKNQRIRKTNTLIANQKQDLQNQKENTAIQIEQLEQERTFVLDEIRQVEEPEEEKQPIVKAPRKRKKVEAPPEPDVEEPLQIYNAGIVLLWPYFSRLFRMQNLIKGKTFVSEEAQFKAIHLIQYLATGQTVAPENELVFNKILCNVPLTTPVPLSVEFTPEELKQADGLLLGAAANWPKMKTMKPPAFRNTFLMREGTIEQEDEKWLINVTKKPFDILLKSLPWGFTFFKLPWLEKFVSVEWKLF
jgi:predicted  nucleic acid-binding Zn-ribbon protein